MSTIQTNLTGRRWKVVVNGKRALNGEPYSATFTGDIQEAEDGKDLYDALIALGKHLKEANAEMLLPDSIQVTIFPPDY